MDPAFDATVVTRAFTGRQLAQGTAPEASGIDAILADGNRAVVLGPFRVKMDATGRVMESEYAFDVTVDDSGLITRFRFFEDSWAVSEAARP